MNTYFFIVVLSSNSSKNQVWKSVFGCLQLMLLIINSLDLFRFFRCRSFCRMVLSFRKNRAFLCLDVDAS